MIRSSLFRKHFAIAAISVLGFIFAGSFANVLLIQRISDNKQPNYQPPLFFARLAEELGKGDAKAGVARIDALHEGDKRPFELLVLNENGKPIYSPDGVLNFEVPVSELPKNVHEGRVLSRGLVKGDNGPRGIPPPPGIFGFFGGPMGPGGPPPGMMPTSVMRMAGEPARYLVFRSTGRSNLPPPPSRVFPITFLSMVFTVLVGVAFALFIIFRSLRDQVNQADQVITQLQRGNLKARFPIAKDDEIGRAMQRFNLMADEIERLMEQLRSVERSRTFLLQELAHDLRTPVASLSNLLDTVFSHIELPENVAELASLAQKETDYIARMVEDLLLLAQVSEPSYRTQEGAVDLDDLLEEEGEALGLRFQGRVKFEKATGQGIALVDGDTHLLRRLFRNALENAFSFASSFVNVTWRKDGDRHLLLTVSDDGPGMSPEMLLTFGERRNRRKIDTTRSGRLSLGLGSVIMKTVVSLHRGELKVYNRPEGGAVIEIRLPVSETVVADCAAKRFVRD